MSDQQENRPIQNGAPIQDANNLHLLDLLIVLVRHKKLVIGTPIVFALTAMAISLAMTPIYTGTAKIMPPQQQQNGAAAAILGQLGGLAGAASGIAGLKNPNDLYVGMLESRSVADNLIGRFKLKERYEQETMDATRAALNEVTEISNGKKDGMISIGVNDPDPAFAAELANAYVDELTKLTNTLAVSEASQRRLFFERQLKEEKDQLASAEVAMRKMQEKTGMIQLDGQVQAVIASIAQLRASISAKEVQLNAMRTFATGQNPDMLRGQEELQGLKTQLAKLEKSRPQGDTDFLPPTGKIPEAGVEYVRALREVKYHETMFELLAKQYELAKMDEAKEASLIQVLDKAVPAERKSGPKRALITIAGLFSGLMLGVLIAFLREVIGSSRNDPHSSERWKNLGTAWRGKS
jgi:tyrosine-protein kinase Etk/Wzc